MFCHEVVQSITLYGSETCILAVSVIEALEIAYMGFYRVIARIYLHRYQEGSVNIHTK